MRLWLAAAVSTCFLLALAGCGSAGSHDIPDGGVFTPGDASPPPQLDSGLVVHTPDAAADSGCAPNTCADIHATCGPQGDGCGGLIDGGCGTCTSPKTCGGGGVANTCGGGCEPRTCASQGIACGPASDGCGGTLNCYPDDAGSCADAGVCGGGGTGQCGPASNITDGGAPDAACVARVCQAGQCGPTTDGCGVALNCGGCDAGGTCGYPTAFFCGYPPDGSVDGGLCVAATCASQSINCGLAGDGCGNILNCWGDGGTPDGGACTNGGVCGAVLPGQCGPAPVADAGACIASNSCGALNCGFIDDGCGNLLSCWPDAGTPDSGAACPSLGSCGGGGTANKCGGSPLPADGGSPCVATTCAAQSISCGLAGDGCGNVLNCWPDAGTGDGGSCPNSGVCGGITAGQCSPGISPDAGSPCVPSKTCTGLNCGYIDNGCGALRDCWPDGGTADSGAACTGLNSCGGGGVANVCGGSPLPADGGSLCHSLTCATQNIFCGAAGDGCGNSLNCYSDGGASCGSGATCESVDGGSVECVATASVCTKLTCAGQHLYCGNAGDGCGGTLDCYPDGGSACADAGLCLTVDGGNVQCVATAPACVKTSCGTLGYNCGWAGDNCGGLLDCNGTGDAGCASPEYCGGGGTNVCGVGYSPPDGGAYVSCSGGTATSITGVAYSATDISIFDTSGQTPDPIYGAYVWVPSDGKLPPITPGVTCSQCSNPPTSLATAITAANGSFTLPNVPVVATSGTATVPVIVQVGRWARLITVTVNPCHANTIPTGNLRLPRNSSEGNLPWFAFDTGDVDSLECVLLKMGVQSSMFAPPATVLADMDAGGGVPKAGGTRVAIYTSPDSTGGAFAPDDVNYSGASLYDSLSTMEKFDAVLFPCVGNEVDKGAGDVRPVVQYANAGGRVFATHYSYVWLYDDYADAPAPVSTNEPAYAWGCGETCNTAGHTVGEWDINQGDPGGGTANMNVNTAATWGQAFGQWMVDLGAATIVSGAGAGGVVAAGTNVQFSISAARWDLDSVNSSAQEWAYYSGGSVQQMTFNTPVNVDAGAQCGRVVFSDFHVNNNTAYGHAFPTECTDGHSTTVTGHVPPLSSQERALEFMLFNLTSCVSSNVPSGSCTLLTCGSYPAGTCGTQSDGCGGTISCATCPSGESCGGGGVANVCGTSCVKRVCSYYGSGVCGTQSDGCGGTISCTSCVTGETCGGGGTPDVCGACVPKTCSAYAGMCGQQADGCGGLTVACNACTSPATCGGGGTPDVCGVPDAGVCTPKSCLAYAGLCGVQSDGCGGVTANCNPCSSPSTCGGGGVADVCGAPDAGTCTPKTCSSYPSGTCGEQSNGCGGLTVACNPCASPLVCGGGGVASVCGLPEAGVCTALTCSAYSGLCGAQSDGCGSLTPDCNPCTSPATCGGGGVANVCGTADAGSCVPKTCTDYPSTLCGEQADGCGGLTAYCNPCASPATCGGGGTPGACASGACAPTTCIAQSIACGPAGDGCGGALSCGTCPTGQTCGGGGVSGQCGGCAPLTCSSPSVGCGTSGDGCGGTLSCPCVAPETCGGGGVAGVCGAGCVPTTCGALQLQCGYQADGCGGLLSCGSCGSGESCISGQCVASTPP